MARHPSCLSGRWRALSQIHAQPCHDRPKLCRNKNRLTLNVRLLYLLGRRQRLSCLRLYCAWPEGSINDCFQAHALVATHRLPLRTFANLQGRYSSKPIFGRHVGAIHMWWRGLLLFSINRALDSLRLSFRCLCYTGYQAVLSRISISSISFDTWRTRAEGSSCRDS